MPDEIVVPVRVDRANLQALETAGVRVNGRLHAERGDDGVYGLRYTGSGDPFVPGEPPEED